MKTKPSVKLIEAVLGVKIEEIDYSPTNTIYYSFVDKDNKYIETNINIYEFAFKVKEWCWNNGIGIMITRNHNGYKAILNDVYGMDFDKKIEEYNDKNNCMHTTEVEAIIKAGEWVLEYSKKNKG